jgi:hypothetical protein
MIMYSTVLFLGGIGGWEILLLSSLLVPLILWIIALVDCLKSEFSGNNKLIWVIVILFFPVVGPILYFLMGRGQRL